MWIDLQRGILEEFEDAQQKRLQNRKFRFPEFLDGFCINNPEKHNERTAVWIAQNPKLWRAINRANVKNWKARNPDKVKAQKRRARHVEKGRVQNDNP